jgi:hypothetical protein
MYMQRSKSELLSYGGVGSSSPDYVDWRKVGQLWEIGSFCAWRQSATASMICMGEGYAICELGSL